MSRPKIGLGRGLEALIPPSGRTRFIEIPLEQIASNPYQPRRKQDTESLQELAASIAANGVLQPIIVSRSEQGYTLIAGERRLRASALAGLITVPAIVREASTPQFLEIALMENIQREDLTPLEEAEAYRNLMQLAGLTQAQVADKVGKSRPAVANALRLLDLSPECKRALQGGQITEGHARALLSFPPEAQAETLIRMLNEHLTVRQTETLSRQRQASGQGIPNPGSGDPGMDEVLAALRRTLGTKVEIRGRRGAGRIIVYFYTSEQLQGLFERMAAADSHLTSRGVTP